MHIFHPNKIQDTHWTYYDTTSTYSHIVDKCEGGETNALS